MPNSSPAPLIYDGAIHGDSRKILNQTFEQQLIANITPVQATNPTSATNLQTAILQAGTLSRVGQSLEIFGAGIVNLTTTTSAATFAVVLGGVTIATFTTTAFAIALNLGWNLTITATVVSVDSGGNITLETHGSLSAATTTAAGAIAGFNDVNIAVSSSIAAGSALTLAFTGLLAAGNAASFINQRQLLAELLN